MNLPDYALAEALGTNQGVGPFVDPDLHDLLVGEGSPVASLLAELTTLHESKRPDLETPKLESTEPQTGEVSHAGIEAALEA